MAKLSQKDRTLIVVDRSKFVVRVWRRSEDQPKWVQVKKYPCATGAEGFATPMGATEIIGKKLNPDWLPPDEDWVGPELRDESGKPKAVPASDPGNPIKAAFIALAIEEGVGFHGTARLDSLGSRASHGCIRMRPEDVLDLFPRVDKGYRVYII